MKLNLTALLYALSEALDLVEHEMIGVQSAHGKHVAYLSFLMGRELGIENAELREFVGCAMLHDNAFTEYASEELYGGSGVDVFELSKRVERFTSDEYKAFISDSKHSVAGEENIALLPFRTDIKDIILYHHENADGTGPMGKTARETSLRSQIVHIADAVDVTWNLLSLTEAEFNEMLSDIKLMSGTFFSAESVELFMRSVKYEDVIRLQDVGSELLLRRGMISGIEDYTEDEVKNIAAFFSRIVDCKSSFVRDHSLGVAEKVEKMARFYDFSDDKRLRIYLAGALHDIGKLIIRNDILEKRGRLTDDEFDTLKNHAAATYEILRRVDGLDDITRWASRHHEKLNGKGYPLGLSADQLSLEDRLMSCADIYQSITEPKPYKAASKHGRAIEMMRRMADRGEIDGNIVEDMDKCFSEKY